MLVEDRRVERRDVARHDAQEDLLLDAGVSVAHTAGFGIAPGMSALATQPAAHRAAARRYLRITALTGAAVAVTGVLFADPLTTIPFGAQWASAVPAVRWAAVAALPVLLCHVGFTMLMSRRQQGYLAGSAVSGAVVGVVATLLLVHWHDAPSSGVIGTVIGAVVMLGGVAVGLRDLLLPVTPRRPAVATVYARVHLAAPPPSRSPGWLRASTATILRRILPRGASTGMDLMLFCSART